MAEHIGIVKAIETDGFALVITDRKGACGGCDSNPVGCRSCLAGASKMERRVANPVGACTGDMVKVQLTSGRLFTGAAILYLLPVVALLLGAFTGTGFAPALGWSELSGGLVGAVIGLALGYLLVVALDRNANVRRRLMPRITAVVSHGIGLPSANRIHSCG